MISFDSTRLRDEWESRHVPDVLRFAVAWMASEFRKMGFDIRVTSLYRDDDENAAVGASSRTHCEWRAIDIALPPGMTVPVGKKLVAKINKMLPITLTADMHRCAPLEHGTAPHFHLQISREEKAIDDEAKRLRRETLVGEGDEA